jgi:hypothetical protein
MYQISPPVPAKDIQVVGVNLNLLANKDVDPHAIAALLPVLYSPQVTSRMNFPVSEDKMLTPSGFPISDGAEVYLASKQPFLTAQTIDQIKGIFGLVMSLLSIALVVFKWFKAPDETESVSSDNDSDDSPKVSDHLNTIATNFSKLE